MAGISQVLSSLSVIELSKPGLEATTYELIVTVANGAMTAAGIIATQLLTPLNSAGCTSETCPSNTVAVSNASSFNASDGPYRFTVYTLVLTCISITATLIFTPLLPRDKAQCHVWKAEGEKYGNSTVRGYFTLSLCVITVAVRGITTITIISMLLFNSSFLAFCLSN